MYGGYKAFLRDLVRLEKAYQTSPDKGPMCDEVLGEFIISLEGVKMLIRSGVQIISMDLERQLDIQQRGNYAVLLPWLKDSLVGSVSHFTGMFGQAIKSIGTPPTSGALPLQSKNISASKNH